MLPIGNAAKVLPFAYRPFLHCGGDEPLKTVVALPYRRYAETIPTTPRQQHGTTPGLRPG